LGIYSKVLQKNTRAKITGRALDIQESTILDVTYRPVTKKAALDSFATAIWIARNRSPFIPLNSFEIVI